MKLQELFTEKGHIPFADLLPTDHLEGLATALGYEKTLHDPNFVSDPIPVEKDGKPVMVEVEVEVEKEVDGKVVKTTEKQQVQDTTVTVGKEYPNPETIEEYVNRHGHETIMNIYKPVLVSLISREADEAAAAAKKAAEEQVSAAMGDIK